MSTNKIVRRGTTPIFCFLVSHRAARARDCGNASARARAPSRLCLPRVRWCRGRRDEWRRTVSITRSRAPVRLGAAKLHKAKRGGDSIGCREDRRARARVRAEDAPIYMRVKWTALWPFSGLDGLQSLRLAGCSCETKSRRECARSLFPGDRHLRRARPFAVP